MFFCGFFFFPSSYKQWKNSERDVNFRFGFFKYYSGLNKFPYCRWAYWGHCSDLTSAHVFTLRAEHQSPEKSALQMGKHPQRSSFCRTTAPLRPLRCKCSSEYHKTRRKTQALPLLNGSDFHKFRLDDDSVESTLELQLSVRLLYREECCQLREDVTAAFEIKMLSRARGENLSPQ